MMFLAGLPRSGSTLLAALLSQRPDTYVSATSGLSEVLGATWLSWQESVAIKASGDGDLTKTLRAMTDAHYADRTEAVLIDKARGWVQPSAMDAMKKVQGDVKIIATVRPVADCLASLVKLIKPDNVKGFCENSEIAKHLFESYQFLLDGFTAEPSNFLFVEYDDLVSDLQGQADRVADFIGVQRFAHSNKVDQIGEDDVAWGIPGLHKIRPVVGKAQFDRKAVLGDVLWNYYQGGSFWNDEPDPVKEPTPLSIQYETLMRGEYTKAKEMCYRLHEQKPDDPDVSFNAGWFKLSDGDVREGYRLLDKGRETMVWGDPPFGSPAPIWKGGRGTVLLRLERGLGDQIHQVRYARDLKERGCKVVVSCSPQLAGIMSRAEGADFVVCHEAGTSVVHDAWLPAMSAPLSLGHHQEEIRGDAYMARPNINVVPGRIGLRWQGFNGYEHQTKRLFPPQLLFDAVQGRDCISLQRDDGVEHRPNWVKEVNLDTWGDTVRAIASCELVITSCTSISHLAGAMGVATWNVVPLVSYYLWTYPGNRTPYYDSMTLFRQTKVDNWDAPFAAIAAQIEMKRVA